MAPTAGVEENNKMMMLTKENKELVELLSKAREEVYLLREKILRDKPDTPQCGKE